ncbi:HAD family hydrolase [Akkermansiaceae bacterium]|nr:HAD family hydrolase [Akkermansiaceae bacterium]
MTRAVIFDLDGTLINSLPGIASSLNRVLKSHTLPTHEEKVVRTFIGDGIAKLVQRAVPNDYPEADLQNLIQMMMDDYAATWKEGSLPYDRVTETLQNLLHQKIGIAVFSNKPDIYCKEITDALFPTIPFTKVLGQREGVPVKPDPTGAFDVASDLDLPIESIAYLGDSTIDVHTAKNAGMLSIAASWGYHDLPALEATDPDHLIHSIEQLLPIISP